MEQMRGLFLDRVHVLDLLMVNETALSTAVCQSHRRL